MRTGVLSPPPSAAVADRRAQHRPVPATRPPAPRPRSDGAGDRRVEGQQRSAAPRASAASSYPSPSVEVDPVVAERYSLLVTKLLVTAGEPRGSSTTRAGKLRGRPACNASRTPLRPGIGTTAAGGDRQLRLVIGGARASRTTIAATTASDMDMERNVTCAGGCTVVRLVLPRGRCAGGLALVVGSGPPGPSPWASGKSLG
jgi:hypothetical protein